LDLIEWVIYVTGDLFYECQATGESRTAPQLGQNNEFFACVKHIEIKTADDEMYCKRSTKFEGIQKFKIWIQLG